MRAFEVEIKAKFAGAQAGAAELTVIDGEGQVDGEGEGELESVSACETESVVNRGRGRPAQEVKALHSSRTVRPRVDGRDGGFGDAIRTVIT